MATEPTTLDNQIAWMDSAESRAFFDRQARARMNMSGEEFLRRLDAGEWNEVIDDPGYRDVLHLSVMADVVRHARSHPRSAPNEIRQTEGRRQVRASTDRPPESGPPESGVAIVWTTPEEDLAEFDQIARARLHMSGEEFLRRLDAGEWDEVIDDPGYQDVLYLAIFADSVR